MSVAPFEVILVVPNMKSEEQKEGGEKLYEMLKNEGIDVLYDDRNERAGVKFNDADLVGIPIRITVGKKFGEGIVEFKERKSDTVLELTVEEAIKKAKEIINAEK